MTPFQALYSYEPPKWKGFTIIETKFPTTKNQLEETQNVLQAIKEDLNVVRNHMKQQADQRRLERKFEVGEWVSVKLQPYKQLSLKQ